METSIQVCVRVRPPTEAKAPKCITPTSNVALRLDDKAFQFDAVFDETCSQADVFAAVGKPTVDGVLEGVSGSVLAYGQVRLSLQERAPSVPFSARTSMSRVCVSPLSLSLTFRDALCSVRLFLARLALARRSPCWGQRAWSPTTMWGSSPVCWSTSSASWTR
jgi:hypothetical protein